MCQAQQRKYRRARMPALRRSHMGAFLETFVESPGIIKSPSKEQSQERAIWRHFQGLADPIQADIIFSYLHMSQTRI